MWRRMVSKHVCRAGASHNHLRGCANLDSALPSSNSYLLMFIFAEGSGFRTTARQPASASRHHSSHDPTVARGLALREAPFFDVWNIDPIHFLFKQGLHRITPRNALAQIYQIVGPSSYKVLSQTAPLPQSQVSDKRLINMRWTRPDSLPGFSRVYWPVVHSASFKCDVLAVINPSSPQNQGRNTSVVACLRRLERFFGAEAIGCLGILAPVSLSIGTV